MPERLAVALLMLFLKNAIELNAPGQEKFTRRTAPDLRPHVVPVRRDEVFNSL
jgi:hypothetical protein